MVVQTDAVVEAVAPRKVCKTHVESVYMHEVFFKLFLFL